MELRHLRYFVAVAEELNFTRAAQRLNTAQPSLSQQIKQLEAHVGIPLLDRSKRHVALTAGGKVFLTEAREILAHIERAGQRAARAQQGKSTELVIGVVPAAEIKILPRLIPLVERRLPNVRLVFHNLPSAEQKRLLATGSLDIGLLRGPLDDPRLEVEDVLWEKLVVGLPAGHPLARKKDGFDSAVERAALHYGLAHWFAGIARCRPSVLRALGLASARGATSGQRFGEPQHDSRRHRLRASSGLRGIDSSKRSSGENAGLESRAGSQFSGRASQRKAHRRDAGVQEDSARVLSRIIQYDKEVLASSSSHDDLLQQPN